MGLQLILLNFLNVEAQKIEGYVTQNDVPGPLVNLSLLAMGPSLNKNETNWKTQLTLRFSSVYGVEMHAASYIVTVSTSAKRYGKIHHVQSISRNSWVRWIPRQCDWKNQGLHGSSVLHRSDDRSGQSPKKPSHACLEFWPLVLYLPQLYLWLGR